MFKLLLSKTDSLKFKRKRNWDLVVNSLFQYFMINVQQRRNRTSHSLQCMRRLIYFSNQMNIRETVSGCHFVYLLLCVQFVCVSGFLCLNGCLDRAGDRCCVCVCSVHSSVGVWGGEGPGRLVTHGGFLACLFSFAILGFSTD